MAEASGMSTSTVNKAVHEVRTGIEVSDRRRAPGGGAKQAIEIQPGLLGLLDELGLSRDAGHADVTSALDVEVDL